jgi:hypothetical protein
MRGSFAETDRGVTPNRLRIELAKGKQVIQRLFRRGGARDEAPESGPRIVNSRNCWPSICPLSKSSAAKISRWKK